jgi:hypothetical protein
MPPVRECSNQVFFASEGVDKPCKTKFNYRSARYTTNWDDLVEVG